MDRPTLHKVILTGQPICFKHTFKFSLIGCDNCGMSMVEAAIQELPPWRRAELKQARDEQLKKQYTFVEADPFPEEP